MRHDRVTDVELFDLGNRGYRLDIVIVQAVPGVNAQPQSPRIARLAANARQLAGLLRCVVGFRVLSGVNLYRGRPGLARRVDLRTLGGDEQGDTDAGVCQRAAHILYAREVAAHVQAAFGRQFRAALGDEADVVRADAQRDGDHAELDEPWRHDRC